MNKEQISRKIANKTGVSVNNSRKAVDGFISVVKEALVNGEDIVLNGFVTMKVKELPSRRGFNVTNKQPENRKPVAVLRITPSDLFKEKIKKEWGKNNVQTEDY